MFCAGTVESIKVLSTMGGGTSRDEILEEEEEEASAAKAGHPVSTKVEGK